MENKFLSEKEYKKIYKFIKKGLLFEKVNEKYPNAVLIGGQPGSGKSQLTKYILSQNPNFVIIDGDYIRELHPHLDQIKQQYKEDYPKITQPFVNRVVEQLINELSQNNYNMIIEGTLRDVNIPIKTARMLDERNYLVELYVIATNKELSWKSTKDRGDRMKEEGIVPRYVDKEHHDKVVNSLPETIQKLVNEESIYNIIIIKRNQEIIYNKNEMPELDPKIILEQELNKKYEKEINKFKREPRCDLESKKNLDEIIKSVKKKDDDILKKDLSNDKSEFEL